MQIQERSPSRRPPSGLSTVRQPALWLACFLVVLLGLLLGGAERVRLLGQDGALGLAVAARAVLVVATLALAGLGTTVSAGRRWLAWSAALLAAALLALGVAPLWPGLALAAGFLLLMRVCRRQLSEPTLTQLSGWLFMTPALVLMLLWVYFPALYALWISLYTDFDYLGAASFVGLENYRIAFTDPLFLRSLVNTGWYVLGTVPLSIGLGVFVAVLLNERIRGLSLFRVIYFLPYITALTAAAAVWSWIFNPNLGPLNWLLGLEGFRWTSNPTGVFELLLAPLGLDPNWLLAGPSVALCSIMIMSVWHFLGYNVVIFLAGLQSISREYYEAARIDGAGWWQQLRYLTWPLLAPTTFFVLIISLIGSLNVFTQILIMTPTGGVLNDTLSVVMYLYFKGFRDFDFGYASALAFILFAITLSLTLLQRRLLNRRGSFEAAEL